MKKILCVLMVCGMTLELCACGTQQKPTVTTGFVIESTEKTTEKITEIAKTTEITTTEETVTEATAEATEQAADINIVTPEFKETMDAYEAFFDEYIEFMQKYGNSDTDDMVAMMSDYTEYLKSYTEMMDKMDSINETELSTADQLYYLEVTGRINEKLLKVSLSN